MSDDYDDLWHWSLLSAPPVEPPRAINWGRLIDAIRTDDLSFPEKMAIMRPGPMRALRIDAHAHLHMMMIARKHGFGWWSNHISAEDWLKERGETVRRRDV